MIAIDGHVHFYPCFDLSRGLTAAIENFSKFAKNRKAITSKVLLLAEGGEENRFQSLLAEGERTGISDFEIYSTQESSSIRAANAQGDEIFLIAGRQIVSEEGLEVLALCTDKYFDNGRTLQKLIKDIQDSGGLPVLPWGFGKWVGKRGQVLNSFLSHQGHLKPLFLGDTSNRAASLPNPHEFSVAEQKGLPVLPGTDPLPFRSEETRIGTFGFLIDEYLDKTFPAQAITYYLSRNGIDIHPFGRGEKLMSLTGKQILLQLRKLFT